MRRVAVIGCGGAGKTSLARRLGELLDIPVVHGDLDRPGWEDAHPGVIAEEAWVIDAMRLGTLDARLGRADTVVVMDGGPLLCLWGILRRRLRYRGGLHTEIGVADFVNWEFLRWVTMFRRRQRPRILDLLACHAATTRVVVVRSYAESEAFLASVAASVGSAVREPRVDEPLAQIDAADGVEAGRHHSGKLAVTASPERAALRRAGRCAPCA